MLRLIQGIVEPRRGDRRVTQRRHRDEAITRDRRTGAERRGRERRAAF